MILLLIDKMNKLENKKKIWRANALNKYFSNDFGEL